MDVEIWSDIACPWCYIGKRRFETALQRFEHRDQVQLTWRSFELDPDAPPERPGDLADRLAEKYGMSVEQARASQQNLTEMAADEGLTYHFDRARSGNTFDAHRIVALAATHGLQDAMNERLLSAYLTEGELVSDPETLVRLGSEVGVPAAAVRETLASDRFAEEVHNDELSARRLGITAVPTFVLDRALGAAGAHPPDQLLALLQQGWEQQPQASAAAQ